MKKRKLRKEEALVKQAELPLRRRAARLQAVANRNETLQALKADMLRSEMMRIKGMRNLAPGNQQLAAAEDEVRKHLRELAR